MTPETLHALHALMRAARDAELDRDVAILGFVKGLVAAGVDDPEALRAQLGAFGIGEWRWTQAAIWARPPVEAGSRRTVRAQFLSRHGMRGQL